MPSATERVLVAVVLIVDDEYFIREFAVSIVEDLGHKTLAASDIAGAMLHLNSPLGIDALVTDIRLEAATDGGYELAQRAIALKPNLRVLYVSGSPPTDTMKDLFVNGAQFLQKPYSPDLLQNSLEALLAT